MSFIKDFKAFALKGNVIDMAIGVIIGGIPEIITRKRGENTEGGAEE